MEISEEEFKNFIRYGVQVKYTTPNRDEGGYTIPQRTKVESPGFINKIKRLLNLGGYEYRDLYQDIITKVEAFKIR